MAVAPLSLRTEDPGLSGVLGMAKVAASGTHLAEARSQSAQGFRVFFFLCSDSYLFLFFVRRFYSIRYLFFGNIQSLFLFVSVNIQSFFALSFIFPVISHWISLWMHSACLISRTGLFRRRYGFQRADFRRADFRRRNASWLAGNFRERWFPVGRLILIC